MIHLANKHTSGREILQTLEENTYIKFNSSPCRSSCKTTGPKKGARCATKRIGGGICSSKKSPAASTCSKIYELEKLDGNSKECKNAIVKNER